jgi:hypothetical protein
MPSTIMIDDLRNSGNSGMMYAVPDAAGVLFGGAIHLDGGIDSMVQDPFQFIWVATDTPALYRILHEFPRVGDAQLVTLDGETGPGLPLPRRANGLTVDALGYVWTGSNPSLRIEPHSASWEEVAHQAAGRPFAYGDEVWFAGDPVHAVSIEPPFSERVVTGFKADVVQATLGHVVALSDGRVFEVDRDTLEVRPLDLPKGALVPTALAADGTGRFVATFGNGDLATYDVLTGKWKLLTVDGWQIRGEQDLLDGTQDVPDFGIGWLDLDLATDMVALDWNQNTPGKSRVQVIVRSADSAEALSASRRVCAFDHPPADLRGCVGGRRHVRIEFMVTRDGSNLASFSNTNWFGSR